MGTLDGRVAIITGAGRGIGREHALLFASEGAKVVVNDLGGGLDGSSTQASPAEQVVEEIKALGGEAVANHDDIADCSSRRSRCSTATKASRSWSATVLGLGSSREQRWHPSRPRARESQRRRLGLRHQGPLEGTLRSNASRRDVLA